MSVEKQKRIKEININEYFHGTAQFDCLLFGLNTIVLNSLNKPWNFRSSSLSRSTSSSSTSSFYSVTFAYSSFICLFFLYSSCTKLGTYLHIYYNLSVWLTYSQGCFHIYSKLPLEPNLFNGSSSNNFEIKSIQMFEIFTRSFNLSLRKALEKLSVFLLLIPVSI